MRPRRWTEDQLEAAVRSCTSMRQVIARLGLRPAGGNYTQLRAYVRELGLSTAHFRGQAWNRGVRGAGSYRRKLEEILTAGTSFGSFKLKRRLFKAGLKPQHCEECGWARRADDGRLPLELDHVNGDATDNRIENLRILCPNCHSLKPTHRGCNRKRRARVVE